MKISFQTKQESNCQQQDAFLQLSGAERFYRFLELSERINKLFPSKKKKENKNFVIEIDTSRNGK